MSILLLLYYSIIQYIPCRVTHTRIMPTFVILIAFLLYIKMKVFTQLLVLTLGQHELLSSFVFASHDSDVTRLMPMVKF